MNTYRQIFRYGLVGLASNFILYAIYLLITSLGAGYKSAMTMVYVVGVTQTFIFNRKWTFSHEGHITHAAARYMSAYALGYLFNLFALLYFVGQLAWPHQIVQGVMIVFLAAFLFVLQKYWVFK